MKLIVLTPILVAALAACAAPPAPTPTNAPALPTSAPSLGTPEEQAVVAALAAKLGLSSEQVLQIQVVSIDAVDWPDGCLGIYKPGVACTQAIVPGFRLLLEYNGSQYEYRTNRQLSQIVPVEGLPVSEPAEQAAIDRLAKNLNLDPSRISLVGNTPMHWSDDCLGVSWEGQTCAPGTVEGYSIVLSVNGFEYEYRTNTDGSLIVPATLALDWQQKGGIAGFCSSLTVFLGGEALAYDCRGAGNGTVVSGVLSSQQRGQLAGWYNTFGQTDIDLSDPRTAADAMLRTAHLPGRGSSSANDADQQNIYALGQSIYNSLGR